MDADFACFVNAVKKHLVFQDLVLDYSADCLFLPFDCSFRVLLTLFICIVFVVTGLS